jgi:DNA-binding MarR family transcriptional regulator
MKKNDSVDTAGRFAYDGLDRVIHEKARLGILTSLVTHRDGLRFNELKALCSLTDGNLNRHLQQLQDASLVDVRKNDSDGRQTTLIRVTDSGRRRFAEYLSVLESVVVDAARMDQSSAAKTSSAWKPA